MLLKVIIEVPSTWGHPHYTQFLAYKLELGTFVRAQHNPQKLQV